MTDIGLCEEGRDAAFGQEAVLNPIRFAQGQVQRNPAYG